MAKDTNSNLQVLLEILPKATSFAQPLEICIR